MCVVHIVHRDFSDKHDSRTLGFVIICNIEVAENKYVIKCIMHVVVISHSVLMNHAEVSAM